MKYKVKWKKYVREGRSSNAMSPKVKAIYRLKFWRNKLNMRIMCIELSRKKSNHTMFKPNRLTGKDKVWRYIYAKNYFPNWRNHV